jgi:hypothetical protein
LFPTALTETVHLCHQRPQPLSRSICGESNLCRRIRYVGFRAAVSGGGQRENRGKTGRSPSLSLVADWGRFGRLVLRTTRNSPWCGRRVVRQRPHPCIRCSIFYDLHKKMNALSFKVSVAEERVYDMSSPSGELCHAPPALRAARPAATPVLLPKSASVNLATTFVVPQTVMSEATNRIEAEVPNEIIQSTLRRYRGLTPKESLMQNFPEAEFWPVWLSACPIYTLPLIRT